MSEPSKTSEESIDTIQRQLTRYACELNYPDLPTEVVHTAKARVIDTLGCLMGAYFGEPGRIVRGLAAQMPDARGATVIGSRMKTRLDMAAFVNATTARDSEMIDAYHFPGSFHGHPAELVAPLLSVAEHLHASGRDYLASLVLGYEVFLRFSNVFHNEGFDPANLSVIGSAVAAGRLFGLSATEMSHCISMAVVPNVILRQGRKDQLTMFKSVVSGQAVRAGVFAAQLAGAGMEGPHLPYEGKAGWCDHVARERLSLGEMGGKGVPFRILFTRLKNRPAEGNAIAPMLAAEKLAIIRNPREVAEIWVETFDYAMMRAASVEHHWNPPTREAADHSIPYVTAVALLFGRVSLKSFDDAHLWNPALRSLLSKVRVTADPAFNKAYEKHPVEHRARVTVTMKDGQKLVAEAGGDEDDLSHEMSDAKIEEKFRSFTEELLGAKRVRRILDRLWRLEEMADVAAIAPELVLD